MKRILKSIWKSFVDKNEKDINHSRNIIKFYVHYQMKSRIKVDEK
jgi:hypothetical protein